MQKITAPSEDRTHDLQIMRLTRCLLRYRGTLSYCQLNIIITEFFTSCKSRFNTANTTP